MLFVEEDETCNIATQCLRFSRNGEDGRAFVFRLVQAVAELKFARDWNRLDREEKKVLTKVLWKETHPDSAKAVEKLVGNQRTINKMKNVTLGKFKSKFGRMTTARNRLVAVFRLVSDFLLSCVVSNRRRCPSLAQRHCWTLFGLDTMGTRGSLNLDGLARRSKSSSKSPRTR